MKWHNKGHEFDELLEYMRDTKTIYFYGCTDQAISLLRQTEWILEKKKINDLEILFVDRDLQKQNQEFSGKRVVAPEEMYGTYESNNGLIIVCTSEHSSVEIWENIRDKRLKRRFHAYSIFEFYRYMSLLLYSKYGIKYFHLVDEFVHTNCNLNCKDCYIQTYRGVRKCIDTDKLKKQIDDLFDAVDYIGIMVLGIGDGFAGGSSMEYALEHLTSKYSERFMTIELVTNGTILPKDSLVKCLIHPQIRIALDDYRENVALARENFNTVKQILINNGINVSELCRSYWYESNFGSCSINKSEEEMCERYSLCINEAKGFPYIGYGNRGKMYSCVMQTINSYHEIVDENDDDGIDLSQNDFIVLNEFLLGYSASGYLSACKRCSGMFEGVELNHVPVAVQIEK